MATISVDYESNAEEWWDAARTGDSRVQPLARIVAALSGSDTITVTRGELDWFRKQAAELPGWNSGMPHAPHPVTWDEEACDPVDEIIRQAQQNSGLSDEAAMDLAVSETRAARRERSARPDERTFEINCNDLRESTGWPLKSHANGDTFTVHYGGAGEPYVTHRSMRVGTLTLAQLAELAPSEEGVP